MQNNIKIAVQAINGLEAVTKREMLKLNYTDAPSDNRKLIFNGSLKDIARLNIFLRTAERIFIIIDEFTATTFDELYEKVLNIDWKEILPINAFIHITANSVLSKLFALPSCQSITKKAIVDKLKSQYNVLSLKEDGAEYKIEVNIFQDNVKILLDTSGIGLHKRGYRDRVGLAPLKETMAAGIILLSNWNKNLAFVDPFCGSGTFPIEAALIGNNIAPGMNRKFDFNNWENYPKEYYDNALTEAKDLIEDNDLNINGYDIDYDAIKLSQYSAQKANVDKYVKFNKRDMREVSSKYKGGVIITNPPYGERLLNEKEVAILYKDFGVMFNKLDNWSAYILTSFMDFEKYMGKKATKNRKLYNAKICCRLYQYLGDYKKNNEVKNENS